MTLAEFHSKALVTNEDAVAAIAGSTPGNLYTYIADGTDSKVKTLLNGIWISQAAFTKEQMLEAAVRTLFPGKGYMRCAASITAMKLAKASGNESELQRIVQERWSSLDELGCNEFVLGLSGNDDVNGWLPVLQVLFESSKSNDVRTMLLKALTNIVRAKGLPEARRLRDEWLSRMPLESGPYSNPNSFQFVGGLRKHCGSSGISGVYFIGWKRGQCAEGLANIGRSEDSPV